jgi:hypothetical protein
MYRNITIILSFVLLTIAGYCQTGIGTASPNSSLDVRGAAAMSIRSFTASTTATFSDYTLCRADILDKKCRHNCTRAGINYQYYFFAND